MTRSIVCGALWVCSVAKTRWPVSAAVSAVEIVSRSRISPTRITSGSWRSAARSPSAKRRRVGADLALVDDAALVPVQELDRILDREDVLGAVAVDPVEQRRERGRLAGAGRAGDEHEAARLLAEVVELLGHPQLVERADPGGDLAERGADALALEVRVDAEAREARHGVREVELAPRLELLLLLGREDPVDEGARLVRGELLRVREALELPVHPHHRRRADREVEVGGVVLDHPGEQFVDRGADVCHWSSFFAVRPRHGGEVMPRRTLWGRRGAVARAPPSKLSSDRSLLTAQSRRRRRVARRAVGRAEAGCRGL